jgi:hypothetical protein
LFGNTHGAGYGQGDLHGYGHEKEKKDEKKKDEKNKGHSTGMLAAAGIGGIAAGALIGHELSMPYSPCPPRSHFNIV